MVDESIFRCLKGRECDHPGHPQSMRHGDPMPEPSFADIVEPGPKETWWVIEATPLRKMMERAAAGEDIGAVMLEEYANSKHEHH